jgi:hypothetical protein
MLDSTFNVLLIGALCGLSCLLMSFAAFFLTTSELAAYAAICFTMFTLAKLITAAALAVYDMMKNPLWRRK